MNIVKSLVCALLVSSQAYALTAEDEYYAFRISLVKSCAQYAVNTHKPYAKQFESLSDEAMQRFVITYSHDELDHLRKYVRFGVDKVQTSDNKDTLCSSVYSKLKG